MIGEQWGFLVDEMETIRNAAKKIYAIRDINGHQWIMKGEQALLEQVQQKAQFANALAAILPVPLYKKTLEN